MPQQRQPITERLPAVELSGPAGTIFLRAPELGSPVLLLVRDDALERARSYIGSLEARLADLRNWYGRPLLVTERAVAQSALATASASAETWAVLGVEAGKSALIIADRWGIVYFAQQTTTFADLPSVSEVEEWLRYLATQCPECGVIDEPGDWAL